MIEAMSKVYVVARSADRHRLLDALADLGVVHLTPVEPSRAVAAEKILAGIDRLRRAIQVLDAIEATGQPPADLDPAAAAEEALAIQRTSMEHKARLAALQRQVDELAVWGDVKLEQLSTLKAAGVGVSFYSIPADEVDQVQADCIATFGEATAGRVLLAAVRRGQDVEVPESAEAIEPPQRDRPTLRAEAREIDRALQADQGRLAELAGAKGAMESALAELQAQAKFSQAERGGLEQGELFAVQGWAPSAQADSLGESLSEAGVPAGVDRLPPDEDDQPPTLIRYPRWVKPIKGLFDILGTLPGYEEFDLSSFFMVAMPVFAAMLIGDAGYGLLFLLLPLAMYRKLVAVAGRPKTHLLIVIGAVTLVWGVLTANYFGVTPTDLPAGGTMGGLRSAMVALGVFWDADPETARFLIIKISFLLGSTHLILAHIRQALGYWPNPKALAEIGWCLVLAGMLGLIWMLFKFPMPGLLFKAGLVCLAAGYVMAVLFAYPEHKLGKRIGFGFAASLLPIISTFGDTMSYIRLMAVGLASYYIASAFNGLGAMVARPNAALWVLGAPIILFGHLLNIGLAVIAIFAHGVRLNMLEFSSNAGVQWAGYAYKPFAKSQIKES